MERGLSPDQVAILRAIRSGGNGHGAGASEDELAEVFAGQMHLLRQLDAEGYVDSHVSEASSTVRMYHRTEKGDAAVRDTDL
jgi:hypothetical protein